MAIPAVAATDEDPGMHALLPSPAVQLFDFTPLIQAGLRLERQLSRPRALLRVRAPHGAARSS